MKPFDIHEPFDAPIKIREAREKAERDCPMSENSKAVIKELCRKAMRKIQAKKRRELKDLLKRQSDALKRASHPTSGQEKP